MTDYPKPELRIWAIPYCDEYPCTGTFEPDIGFRTDVNSMLYHHDNVVLDLQEEISRLRRLLNEVTQ